MAQLKFGGAHTVQKLDCLESYLRAYLKVFKNLDWAHTIYVDAFAGTGEVPLAASYPELPLDQEGQAFIVGSAKRALSIPESFREYVFIEKKRGNARALEQLKTAFPEKKNLISILHTDANTGLQKLCADRDWRKCRSVVFLDPFGSQVEWKTVEAVAATKAIDLWYPFSRRPECPSTGPQEGWNCARGPSRVAGQDPWHKRLAAGLRRRSGRRARSI